MSHLVPFIEEDRHKCKLKLLLAAWKEARPDTYVVETLKAILSQEGFTDMYRWICLMTVNTALPRRREQEPFRSRNHFSSRSFSVRSRPSPSPMSDYLYSPGPYSQFFGTPRQQSSSSSGSSESSTFTSPVSRSASVNSSVYTQLYKPDLIKLSSPAQRQTRLRREEEGSRWSPSINQTNRDDFTKNWVENNEHRYQK